jgi:hypothetical protein
MPHPSKPMRSWALGSKLPPRYAFDNESFNRYDLVFKDLENQRMAPFDSVALHCLDDRTIYEIEGYANSNAKFDEVLATLNVKYGQGKARDWVGSVGYDWQLDDSVLSLSTGSDCYCVLITYKSTPLELRHEQEVKTKQEAAGAGFAPHL